MAREDDIRPWHLRRATDVPGAIISLDDGADRQIVRALDGSELEVDPACAGMLEAAPLMLATLRGIEWAADAYEDLCPACYGMKFRGHEPDCTLAAALAMARDRAS